MTSLSAERALAIELARTAGELLRGEVHGPRRIAFKDSPTNLVTEMDARVEALIVERLLAAFPEDAILAEERGAPAGAGSSTRSTAPPTTPTACRSSPCRSRSRPPAGCSSA